MRWLILNIVLLATISVALSSPRHKRDFSYIKNLIMSKLFGQDTIYVQPPKIPKDEPYQLFKVQGHDNILIKVTRKKEKPVVHHPPHKVDPVIVKPEVAIIGDYIGTKTHGETLVAMETVKDLLHSGILEEHKKPIKETAVHVTPHLPVEIHPYTFRGQIVLPVPIGVDISQPVENHEPVLTHEHVKLVHPKPIEVVTKETHPMYLPHISSPFPVAVDGPAQIVTEDTHPVYRLPYISSPVDAHPQVVTVSHVNPPVPVAVDFPAQIVTEDTHPIYRLPYINPPVAVDVHPQVVTKEINHHLTHVNPPVPIAVDVPAQVVTKEIYPMHPLPHVHSPVVDIHPQAVHEERLLYNFPTKYFYEQKGHTADMIYETQGPNVIVTRLEKEPILPEFIKVRFSELAGIDAHHVRPPVRITDIHGRIPQAVEVKPNVYAYKGPLFHFAEPPQHKPRNDQIIQEMTYKIPEHLPEMSAIKTKSVCNDVHACAVNKKHVNIQYPITLKVDTDDLNQEIEQVVEPEGTLYTNQRNTLIDRPFQRRGNNVYQMAPNTNVNNAGDAPKLENEAEKTKSESKNFIFVPPQNVDEPLPISAPNANNSNMIKNNTKIENEKDNYPEIKGGQTIFKPENLKLSLSLLDPIVVEELDHVQPTHLEEQNWPEVEHFSGTPIVK